MGKIKGCVNQDCLAKQNKIKYKETECYCSKCGQELSFVCAKCYTVIQDNNAKYCIRCLENEKDKKTKIAKAVGAAGGVALGVAVVVKGIIKKII